jgi:hypothetical protein
MRSNNAWRMFGWLPSMRFVANRWLGAGIGTAAYDHIPYLEVERRTKTATFKIFPCFRKLVAAFVFTLPGVAIGAQTLIADGRTVEYWQVSNNDDAYFRFFMRGYRNKYRLDCRNRRFLWIENRQEATGQVTNNTWSAEWRRLNPRSKIANAVYEVACPTNLGSSVAQPQYSAGGSNVRSSTVQVDQCQNAILDAAAAIGVDFGTEMMSLVGCFSKGKGMKYCLISKRMLTRLPVLAVVFAAKGNWGKMEDAYTLCKQP